MVLYLDGVVVGMKPTILATGTSATVNIGRSITATNYFNGALDDITIYDQALDADQIKAQFPASTAYWGAGEGTGTSIADSSGNNHAGTLSGGATWTTGVSGYGLRFDGSTGYASAGWNLLAGNAARTISTWFKITSTADSDWVSWGTDATNALSQLGTYQGRIGYLGYANELTVPATAYADGNWHQLAATFDGATMVLYLDGVQAATKSTTLATGASSTINIGRSISGAANQYFNGALDGLAIYSQALSPGQIAAAYRQR
jgi:Concanavalin A-like lectin/glucanases superfamily